MAVIRVNKTQDYTVMSNFHLKDKRLSLKAKGLLSIMLSLSEEWQYSISGLVAISKENETAIKSTLSELKKHGYLVITKKLPNETQNGRFGYQYDIYEHPQKKQEGEKQGVENLPLEIQPLEILEVENQGQLNTNISNTKNKDTNNKIYSCVIDYLNEKAGTKFKSNSKSTQQHINARVKEGFTLDDFKTVIDKKCDDWKGTEWEQYLRPSTLFGTKFENYLNAAPKPKKTEQPKKYIEGVDYVEGVDFF